ncbi:MAG TPA: hypothetical protein VMV07_15675 [Streptosporangiaceae bacterium]|nr:hypothetical protein [Streptosporangiaceae bacterium]
MSLGRADFAKFFAAANGGRTPFAWQERLLDTLLVYRRWPDQIAAPTGAGKTSAIDVHVFAVALTAGDDGPRLPRRLAMVVGRRVLVDDQYERAQALARALARPGDDLTAEIARRLAGFRWPAGPRPDNGQSPLVTARMRGGAAPSRSWREYPAACAVLCSTPDMWGSRLLFGGYGTSDLAAPREAGMLAFDTAVIVDEAHLSRQLLVTARQVSHLASVANRLVTGVPALQVVETSATPATGDDRGPGRQLMAVAVNDADLSEKLLASRLTRPKPVTLLSARQWPPARQPGKAAGTLADAVTSMLQPPSQGDAPVHTVGCFVNTVPMAVAVTDVLRSRSLDGRALRVVMVCGQIRPADLVRLTIGYPTILKPEGDSDVDVIVATQSLEVGADIDLAGIVTELAAGSALAQRAGRANRRGQRDQVPVTVLVPDEPITERTRSGPYTHQELAEALAWVTERAVHPEGLAPWALREHQSPAASRRRVLYQRPELADAWYWARTSDDLAAAPELDLWLAESLEDETSVGVVVRDALPDVPAEAVEFVRDLPPAAREIFPVPYRTALAVLTGLLKPGRPLIRIRGEDIAPLHQRARADGTTGADLRPGDVVVIDSSSEIFTPSTAGADGGFSPPVVAAPASGENPDGLEPARLATADDVLHQAADPGPGEVVLRLEAPPEAGARTAGIAGLDAVAVRQVLDEFADGFEERTERDRRDFLAGLLRASPRLRNTGEPQGMLDAAIALLHRRVKDSDVILRRDEEQRPVRVLVIDRRRATADEDLRQVFSDRDGPVLLDHHQGEVSARAGLLADRLGLSADIAGALRLAGAHHDDGKADPRFQVRLGAQDRDIVLAKSDPGSTVQQVREREALAGLPGRWRHEQLSVACSWDAIRAEPGVDALLVERLVGTSHGHGRSGFPHTGGQLAGDQFPGDLRQLAIGLFDHGGWDELIETTQVRYGVWGCAYLEAVLRAADGQVSGEGK